MADWQVISPEQTVHSAIAPLGIWGWPYLFCKGIAANPVTGEGRVWIGTAEDNKMNSGSHWKWNMKWKVMMDGPDILTDTAPAVGAAWGMPVVFIRRKDGAIFYSTYKISQATPWQKLSGTTDRALAATGVLFDNKMHLFAFAKGINDNKVYCTRTSDSGDIKTWSPWASISGNFETDRALAAASIKTPAGSKLFVFAKPKGSNRISYTFSPNGSTWTPWKNILVNQTPIESVQHLAPAATAYNDKVYVTFYPPGSPTTGAIKAAVYSPDTDQWSTRTLCAEVATSPNENIAIRGYADDLFVFLHSVPYGQVIVQHAIP